MATAIRILPRPRACAPCFRAQGSVVEPAEFLQLPETLLDL